MTILTDGKSNVLRGYVMKVTELRTFYELTEMLILADK